MKKKRDPNYRGLFVLALAFIALGVVFSNQMESRIGIVFIALGGLFLIISFKNKDKWKNTENGES